MWSLFLLALKRLTLMLAACAFLALPASSEPACDPHEDHDCAAHMMEHHAHDHDGSHDPATHEHDVHSHGNCHVPMIAPGTLGWASLMASEARFLTFSDDGYPAGPT